MVNIEQNLQHFHTKHLQRTSQELLGQTSQLDILVLYTSYICIYIQPQLAAPVGVGVSAMGAPNRCQGQTAAATRRLQYAGALLLLFL